MATQTTRRDPDLYLLVPYEYARRRHEEGLRRAPEEFRDRQPPAPRPPSDRPVCPVCGAGPGRRGFIRMPFPPGHELFGKAICCPRCWPSPFGSAPGGHLGQIARDLAGPWQRIMAGFASAPGANAGRLEGSS